MRDESKAAVVVLLSLIVLALLAYFHPDTHIFEWRGLPPRPSPELPDESLPPGRFDEFIARYGPPTLEEQSERGVLHPPLFTKWLDYEPEHLRVAFVAAEAPGETHVRSWVLIAFLDSTRPEPISALEAGRRLMSRQR
jgi:hypothetical protein